MTKGVSVFKINRTEPAILSTLPRLIARLNLNDVNRPGLIAEHRQTQSGYEGEREVDRHLEKAHFPGPFQILTNVELEISTSNFIQIDTLIMTTSYIFVLEIKNISGTLEFLQDPPRLKRTLDNGDVHIFGCPEEQLEKNIGDLEIWLARNGLPQKPTGAIILAYSKTEVKVPPLRQPIFYAKHLPQVLRKIKSNPTLISSEQLHLIANKIRNAQRPFNPFPLCTHFRINPASLRPGVYCSKCHAALIQKTARTWRCNNCDTLTGHPFFDNVKDWFTLVKGNVTNKELRHFLNLKNKDASYHVLKTLPLKKSGQNKSTKYHWPKPLHY